MEDRRGRVTHRASLKEVNMRDRDGTETGGEVHKSRNGSVELERNMKEKLLLRKKAEQLKVDLIRHFDSQLNEFVDSLMDEPHGLGSSSRSGSSQPLTDRERTKLRSSQGQSKQFVVRRSLLDELFEVNHIRTIYHMFIALLILFILSTVVVDFIDEGRLVLDFDLLVFAFGQFPLVVVSWTCMFVSALLVPFVLLRWWAGVYSSSHHRTFYTLIAVTLLLLYQSLGLGFLPAYIVLKNSLPPASCFILILEQDWWNSTSFANYYRTWNVVVHDWLYCYVYRDFLWMTQKRFRATAMFIVFTVSAVVHEYVLAVCFGFFYPVLFCLFMCFGMMFNFILHDRRTGPVWNIIVWTALFLGLAVLLCLYSQEWYAQKYCPLLEDWWNSTSFANYYRTWNVVVHDWLYCYVYRDFLWMTQKRFRATAMFIVFTVSAVVHEYVLAVCFGFFYPVLFCLFMCFGMMFNFILHDRRTGPVWNIIVWTALFLGLAVLLCLYSQEWYAQKYCPLLEQTRWLNLVTLFETLLWKRNIAAVKKNSIFNADFDVILQKAQS
ncbi:hypothetical protein PDJAM_G00237100 [Pangasius djambal]|uniref:Uncharacterized protein n=1 Tax=Pangasius djambal TaxID=1691987 RepID=A0ACC5YFW0_9TELE|nr:hypothetical protein [Pangasius djambal]